MISIVLTNFRREELAIMAVDGRAGTEKWQQLRRRLPAPGVVCCYLTVPLVAYVLYALAALLQIVPCLSITLVEVDVGPLCAELVRVNAIMRVYSPSKVRVRADPLLIDVSDLQTIDKPMVRMRIPAQEVAHGEHVWNVSALVEVINASALGELATRAINGPGDGRGAPSARFQDDRIALTLHGAASTSAFFGLPLSVPLKLAVGVSLNQPPPPPLTEEEKGEALAARERRCGCGQRLAVHVDAGALSHSLKIHWASPERLHVSITLTQTLRAMPLLASLPPVSTELLVGGLANAPAGELVSIAQVSARPALVRRVASAADVAAAAAAAADSSRPQLLGARHSRRHKHGGGDEGGGGDGGAGGGVVGKPGAAGGAAGAPSAPGAHAEPATPAAEPLELVVDVVVTKHEDPGLLANLTATVLDEGRLPELYVRGSSEAELARVRLARDGPKGFNAASEQCMLQQVLMAMRARVYAGSSLEAAPPLLGNASVFLACAWRAMEGGEKGAISKLSDMVHCSSRLTPAGIDPGPDAPSGADVSAGGSVIKDIARRVIDRMLGAEDAPASGEGAADGGGSAGGGSGRTALQAGGASGAADEATPGADDLAASVAPGLVEPAVLTAADLARAEDRLSTLVFNLTKPAL